MGNTNKTACISLIMASFSIFITATLAIAIPDGNEHEQPVLVGRVSHVAGNLSKYDSEEQDWLDVHKNEPFGFDDILRSGSYSKAELIMPNNALIRMGEDTQIRLIVLGENVTVVDIKSGLVRFYNRGSEGTIRVSTPFGQATAPAGTGFDLEVADEYLELSSIQGTTNFRHSYNDIKFEVIEGSSSLIADDYRVSSGDGVFSTAWVEWNLDRDNLWQKRAEIKGESAEYLPSSLHHHAYILEKHGRWSRVYYDGGYYYFWRPLYVGIGWSPFTVGTWATRYGDPCWIPNEPFGYITHHFGNWIFTGGLWHWAPPIDRVKVRLGLPLLNIQFGWNPGRVGWVHSDIHIGWVPLGPRERYYGKRRWGRHSVVLKKSHINNGSINIGNYRHLKHAVIIDKKNFYLSKNYREIRVRNIKRERLLNKYRARGLLDKRAIRAHKITKAKHKARALRIKRNHHKATARVIRQNRLAEKRHLKLKEAGRRKADIIERRKIRSKRIDKRIRKNFVSANRERALRGSTPLNKGEIKRSERKEKKIARIKSRVEAVGSRPKPQKRERANLRRENKAKLKNPLERNAPNRKPRLREFSKPETRKVREREIREVRNNSSINKEKFNGRSREFRSQKREKRVRHRRGETRGRM